jgi:hypothetical protein
MAKPKPYPIFSIPPPPYVFCVTPHSDLSRSKSLFLNHPYLLDIANRELIMKKCIVRVVLSPQHKEILDNTALHTSRTSHIRTNQRRRIQRNSQKQQRRNQKNYYPSASNTYAKKTTYILPKTQIRKNTHKTLRSQENQAKITRKTLQNPARLMKNSAGLP